MKTREKMVYRGVYYGFDALEAKIRFDLPEINQYTMDTSGGIMDAKNVPLHKVIRDNIINDILRDIYEPGSLLPKQENYAEQFGVSRTTVRKAIDDLVRRGVLITVKGKGTFVCNYKRSRHSMVRTLSYSEAISASKHLVSKVLLQMKTQATIGVARQLQIEEGATVICLRRLRLVNELPFNLQTSYLNWNQVSNIDFNNENFETASLFKVLKDKAMLIPKFQEEEIRAVRCPEDVAGHLGIEPNDPVLLIFRTVYSENGKPMEYCEDYECTDLKGLKITTTAVTAPNNDT